MDFEGLHVIAGKIKAILKVLKPRNVKKLQALAAIIIGNTNLLAKVGIKSCRFATECVSFVCN